MENYTHRWIEDVERIQSVLKANGINLELQECESIWNDYSDAYCAGWMGLPEDDKELFLILNKYYTRPIELTDGDFEGAIKLLESMRIKVKIV